MAELGDGPAEAVVVDGLRSYYRFDIVRGRVRRDDAAVAEEVYGRVGEELLRVRRRVGVVEPPDAAAELLDAPRAGRDVLLLNRGRRRRRRDGRERAAPALGARSGRGRLDAALVDATVFRFRDSPGCGDAFLPIVAPRRTMWYSPCEVPGADSRGAGSMSKMRHPEKPVWTNLHVLAQRMGPRGAEATRNRRRAT